MQTSLQLGSLLLRGLGVMSNDVSFLRQMMRESMELRAQQTLDKKVAKDSDWLVAFQVNEEGLSSTAAFQFICSLAFSSSPLPLCSFD